MFVILWIKTECKIKKKEVVGNIPQFLLHASFAVPIVYLKCKKWGFMCPLFAYLLLVISAKINHSAL